MVFLSTHHVLLAVLCAEDIAVSQKTLGSYPHRAYSLLEDIDTKQICILKKETG
jgi:hypothetical protein